MTKTLIYITMFSIVFCSSCNSKKSAESKEKNQIATYELEDLKNLSSEELRIKRNEIYARKGYIFNSSALRNHFTQFDWYKPQYNNVQSLLSKTDHENISKILKAERLLNRDKTYDSEYEIVEDDSLFTKIELQKIDGVYQIPIKINGTKMMFIFDTGASSISISLTEALFLHKNGTLSDDDILGKKHYKDATGKIHEGTIVNLKEVKIGNITLNNIKANVVDNLNAPLLLGQSALSKFTKFEIDYQSETLIIKK